MRNNSAKSGMVGMSANTENWFLGFSSFALAEEDSQPLLLPVLLLCVLYALGIKTEVTSF